MHPLDHLSLTLNLQDPVVAVVGLALSNRAFMAIPPNKHRYSIRLSCTSMLLYVPIDRYNHVGSTIQIKHTTVVYSIGVPLPIDRIALGMKLIEKTRPVLQNINKHRQPNWCQWF